METSLIFYTISFFILAFLVIFIIVKKVFHSLIASIFVFVSAGFIFFLLGTEYNAIIQIAIYGVAVPIILGLSIMFNQESKDKIFQNLLGNINYYIATISFLLLLLSLYLLIARSPSFFIFNIQNFSIYNNTPNLISLTLFNNYILQFELVSILLTIAVVGFSLFNKEVNK